MAGADPSALVFFAGTYAAVVSLPGPNFLVVSHASLSSRATGTAAALGVALGATAAATATVLGLGFAERLGAGTDFRVLELGLGLLYGILLLRAGFRCIGNFLRGESVLGSPGIARPSVAGAFQLGLLTAATNPTTLAYFVSAHGALLAGAGLTGAVAEPVLVFSVALFWFGTLGLVLSSQSTRRLYVKGRIVTDAGIGGLLILSGGWAMVRTVARMLW